MAGDLVARQRGGGDPLSGLTQLMVRSEWTRDAYCILDQVMAPRVLTPVHEHAREDQVAFVLEGTLTCWVDGSEEALAPGGCAARPAGIPHTLWNATDEPVRLLEITSPGINFQRWMEELKMLAAGDVAPGAVATLAASHGITFHPEQTERLRERLGLTVRSFGR